MKIGIIVHSHTGNTLLVAQDLQNVLNAGGHSVNLERVTACNENPSATANIQLSNIPDIKEYDVLIFGAPVRGFSLSPVMKIYLTQIASLEGKKVGCFVTHFFPFASMGGTQSILQMKTLCESKNAFIFDTGIINWSNFNRKREIKELLEKLSRVQ